MLSDDDRQRIREEEEERLRVRRELEARDPDKQQRVYEEEKIRDSARRYTPTDWLASCILGPVIVLIVGGVIVIAVFLAFMSYIHSLSR